MNIDLISRATVIPLEATKNLVSITFTNIFSMNNQLFLKPSLALIKADLIS